METVMLVFGCCEDGGFSCMPSEFLHISFQIFDETCLPFYKMFLPNLPQNILSSQPISPSTVPARPAIGNTTGIAICSLEKSAAIKDKLRAFMLHGAEAKSFSDSLKYFSGLIHQHFVSISSSEFEPTMYIMRCCWSSICCRNINQMHQPIQTRYSDKNVVYCN